MKRKIVHIDQETCNGCGLCIDACHERAIEMVDGKAQLISDHYCDGLGDCLPACPTGAIEITEREAAPFDEEAVQERVREVQAEARVGCPASSGLSPAKGSQRGQWPVQLALVNPEADFLKGAHLLVSADCAAYVHASFHQEFLRDTVPVIGCPKLDDRHEAYTAKLASILRNQDLASITVVRMEVPCCSGLVNLVKKAMLDSEVIVPDREVVLGVDGDIRQG